MYYRECSVNLINIITIIFAALCESSSLLCNDDMLTLKYFNKFKSFSRNSVHNLKQLTPRTCLQKNILNSVKSKDTHMQQSSFNGSVVTDSNTLPKNDLRSPR